MQTEQAIRERRATKAFDPAFQLPEQEKRELLELALLAPSAFHLQHVRLVEISDPELRRQLRAVAWDQPQITDASMLVVVCAREDCWETHASRIWQEASAEVRAVMEPAIDAYYRNKPRVQRDETMRSCGLFAQTLMLAAKGRGLDSCPMDGFDFDAVAKLINLPQNHLIGLMVAVGKAAKPSYPRIGKLPYDEVVIHNHF